MAHSPKDEHKAKLDHARWRVNFRRSLLQAHRQAPTGSADWTRKVQEFEEDLKRAEQELSDLEREGPSF